MKISKLELISLILAAAFGAFAAGWFLRGASSAQPVRVETEHLLAQPTAVVLPTAQPSATPDPSPAVTAEQTPAPDGKIDLNTATAEELMTLPGIGEKRAADIIADREANGPFRMPEDLARVDGIGEGILEGLIDLVTVS
ncbi:ComEA family DNA-binding protein [uncultured Flavonifractor sp.]|uniref:ComEA family DNA-binding protein n=1 Tax=uncultured Flavonifractor sp. TaxID=1193534 RepID=UPI0026072D9C|nr:ComEA family DNA-binding protein [uncultured Flavonifractor sp.]